MFLKAPSRTPFRSILQRCIPFAIAVLFGVSLIHTASLENQIIDESVHLSAGASYLRTHDFRLNPEHPSLLKQLAAVPLLPFHVRVPTEQASWERLDQWRFGDVFMHENVLSPDQLLFWGRLPTMILAAVLVLTFYGWTKTFYGIGIATVLSLMLILDPTIVAHSRYVTSDLGVTLGFLWSIILFQAWLNRPSRLRTLGLLFAVLFTVLAKFSGLYVFFVLGLMWCFTMFQRYHAGTLTLSKEIQRGLTLGVGGLLFLFLGIWAAYHFQVPAVRDVYADRLETIAVERWDWRFPALPYVRGVGTVLGHSKVGHQSYLLGEQSATGGWWYYFPVTFFAKATPAMLIFTVLLLLLGMKRLAMFRRFTPSGQSVFVSIRPDSFASAAMVLTYSAAALVSNINIGIRHLLPIFPFLLFLFGHLFQLRFRSRVFDHSWKPLLGVILFFSTLSVVLVYPNVLTYFSPFVGGPAKGGNIVVDSNLDWGQDLKKLKTFMDRRGISTIAMQYFGKARVSAYGIQEVPLPTDEELREGAILPPHAAISASILFPYREEYRWLFDRQPTARIGNSIYYYDLTTGLEP